MEQKGIQVQEIPGEKGYEADYRSIGIHMGVNYIRAGTLTSLFEGELIPVEIADLVLIASSEGQKIVEDEADELLKSIGEVEDPTSVQLWLKIAKE